MNDIFIFALIALLGFLPAAIFIVYKIYKNTILFPIIIIIFSSAIFCSLMAFIISQNGFWSLVWIMPLCILALAILNYTIRKIIQKPLLHLKKSIDHSAQGVLNFDLDPKILRKRDEIGSIAQSFNTLIQALNKTAEFSDEIGKGNYDLNYDLLSAKDKIGIALLSMRDSLIEGRKKEMERKTKENQENWTNQGIAKFAEILRTDSHNMEALALKFIMNLVDYVNCVQGGIFVLNEDIEDKMVYELQGAVAYNREKTLQKSFALGESLVGRCAYEKLPIYMTDVPDNYVNITSGLGTANPNCILLIPAILNNKVYAVIEIVSFDTLEEYQINFVLALGENLASTIFTTRNNEQTQQLLEKTKKQQEELAAQEEEIRQNLEELQATQEEMQRKENELAL